jgi:hypothetical protein
VERFHQALETPIICHADQQWTESLPLVLLGNHTTFKEDLLVSAELVYGEPLRILGELLTPTADPVDPATHASPATFVHSDLEKCTQDFLRQGTTRWALESSYSCPYQVLSRREKTLQLLMRGRPVTVSTDRVKPAYILDRIYRGNNSFNPPVDATPATSPQPATRTTRSGPHTHFPARFYI